MNWESVIVNLECIDSLPTLPNVFTKVMHKLDDPKTTVDNLATAIESDQAISMKLLKIVNSPFFGFSRKIATVHDAISMLGFDATRNTLMSLSAFHAIDQGRHIAGFDMQEFWKHSISTGIVARFLANKTHIEAEKAFVAGIIHDIEKVILAQYFKQEIKQVLESIKKKKMRFYDAELDVYGGTHCDLGSYVADKWNLPMSLIDVIDMHHTPVEATDDPELVSLIHIANVISKGLGFGISGLNKSGELEPYAFVRLDITAAQLNGWLEEIQKEVDLSHEIFELQTNVRASLF